MPATDPTFYRLRAPPLRPRAEELAYVAAFDPASRVKDAIAVVDCDPGSQLRRRSRMERTADSRKRTSPFRLERMLERVVPRRP